MTRLILTFAIIVSATLSRADAPRVVTDIAPVHSLVTQVMEGVGTPDLIVPPGADAHHLALRPSDARKLSQAQIVVWVGPALTPWLTDPLATLAPTAATLTLLDVPGWTPRPLAKDHAHVAGDSHDTDPHAWLNPEVAVVWVHAIRDTLSTTDPDNAATYAANADRAVGGLVSLRSRISAELAGVQGNTWVAPHGAFGYFSDRFQLPSADAVSDSDDAAPGPTHLTDLRQRVEAGEIVCVLSETNGPTDYADLLTDGTTARTGVIDDTGMALSPGTALYADLLTGIAATLKNCIAP